MMRTVPEMDRVQSESESVCVSETERGMRDEKDAYPAREGERESVRE
jgi:hypothetical protein